ncbi:MAG: hypothetical protein U0807_03520 [Candidatus Binatia bacterium]
MGNASRWTIRFATLLASFAAGAIARADVTGSFDGQISGPSLPVAVNAAAAFSQAGKAITGTIALDGTLAGAYTVNGRATPKKVKLSGFGPGGARLTWAGKIGGDTVAGKVRVKGSGKLGGVLAMTRNVSSGDGAGCDAVYTQNADYFATNLLGDALTACTACHVPGGTAGPTRLHVLVSDPLATARSIALLVDPASPTTSRIVVKPLLIVPHGGNQAIVSGSTQEQSLRQWVDLVTQAHCN